MVKRSIDISFATTARRPKWTARCKSGYQINGHVCKRLCSRGQLLCSDCATAQVVHTVRPESLLSRMARNLAEVLIAGPLYDRGLIGVDAFDAMVDRWF